MVGNPWVFISYYPADGYYGLFQKQIGIARDIIIIIIIIMVKYIYAEQDEIARDIIIIMIKYKLNRLGLQETSDWTEGEIEARMGAKPRHHFFILSFFLSLFNNDE